MQIPSIPAFDLEMAKAAEARQAMLTKPLGSLGKLERLGVRLAGMTGKLRPQFKKKAHIIMAADHGIAKEGVSAFPQEVTPQMVLNFLTGGAAVNVFARMAEAEVTVVDIGVAYDFKGIEGLIDRKIAWGTQNMLHGPAMTREQAEQAIQIGMDIANEVIDRGADMIGIGEVGIGNTTPSATIIAMASGRPVSEVTSRGTGLDDPGLARKIEIIEAIIERHKNDCADPISMLANVGGFEIGGMAGVVLAAAARRVPVVVDGYIAGVAALIAVGLAPEARNYLIASHESHEPGAEICTQLLGLEALFDLNFRLGEGTGSVLAFHFVEAAARIQDEMATFAEAGVDEKL